ncbi:MAG TPA: sialidase family protein [Anaerolineae bacterium]|jgi:hypothetical protein|nr:sialidase family protein [Anaerolineae bacterium]
MMTLRRRVGSRAPSLSLAAAVLALLLLPALALGSDWTSLSRVSTMGGSRLDSLHQLAGDRGTLHLVHPRIGPSATDDRVVYQNSTNAGASWSKERTLFSATLQRRQVVPNLAIGAKGDTVAVAWRVNGPTENTLFVRVSRDRGQSFGVRREVFSTSRSHGVGVPAVAVGNGVIAVAWTNRANGKIKIRVSRDGGRTFTAARTLGRTSLSIDCKKRLTDGLVGLAINDRSVHVAWSHAPTQQCLAKGIKVRTSLDRGKTWSSRRTVSDRRNYGWPELDARGKSVIATVQSPTGGLIVARSGQNGRTWNDRLIKPARGHSLSAADVTLLPKGKALIVYVDERIKSRRLVSTKVVSRHSPDDGRTWRAPTTVAGRAQLLRMAPNVAANGAKVTIVLQSGQMDGSPRNIFAARLR